LVSPGQLLKIHSDLAAEGLGDAGVDGDASIHLITYTFLLTWFVAI
jgi:hypothetical protein